MQTSPAFDEIADSLSLLDDWEDRYRYLIELGQALDPLDDTERTLESKVSGCASQVWVVVEDNGSDDPVLIFRGDSDALIVKGLIAVVIALYSGRRASDIAGTDALPLFDEIGLREHLSTQRANGLASMVARIRAEAAARAKA